ncbi:yeats family-domain-containing protein [Phycomyces blakesleeanus]|uniref:Yeats family-domain-containing protein n=1 Tax=Phycomyces blakesleeanus TaxID=4837 RepID=A0ABR3B6K2_PHYBL
MTEASQDIRITCQNSIIKGASATSVDGHPWRTWKIKLVAMDGNKEKKGKLTALLDNVEYILHPTFENPHRVTTKEPYVLQEKGWGEFDMRIVLNFAHKLADPETILFDLNFTQPSYTVNHRVVFQNPSPELEDLLALDVPADVSSNGSIHSKKRRSSTSSSSVKTPQAYSEHDSVPYLSGMSDESQRKSGSSGSSVKRGMPLDAETRRAWGIPEGLDMMELARRLTHMTEDQAEEFHEIVKQSMTDDMAIEEKEGELVLELYSLGPTLLNRLWEYSEKISVSYNPLSISPHINTYDQDSEAED